jgi:hypothetical protein
MDIIFDDNSLLNLKEWFSDYVKTFRTNDSKIKKSIDLKELHTKRVCREIVNIGKQLDLQNDALNLAEAIGLLHDVGRFEQYTVYKTFKDKNSVNHAELGIEILDRYKVLEHTNQHARDIIMRSVKYHNRINLPAEETPECLFYAKLIRDADKLDILKVVTEHYNSNITDKVESIELGLPDTPGFSDEVYNDLMNKRIVNMKNVQNLNDFKLLQVGWVFDINFQPTLQSIRTRGYLDLIRGVLPKTKEIDHVFDLIELSLLN